MCNCLEEFRHTRFPILKDNETQLEVSIQGVTLQIVGNRIFQCTYQDASVRVSYQNKQGEDKTKLLKTVLLHSYCPFCGKPYEPYLNNGAKNHKEASGSPRDQVS